MPKITQTLDAEQAEFNSKVKQIEEWWSSPRQSHIKRKVISLSPVVHG
jgi:isocitrate lyase